MAKRSFKNMLPKIWFIASNHFWQYYVGRTWCFEHNLICLPCCLILSRKSLRSRLSVIWKPSATLVWDVWSWEGVDEIEGNFLAFLKHEIVALNFFKYWHGIVSNIGTELCQIVEPNCANFWHGVVERCFYRVAEETFLVL